MVKIKKMRQLLTLPTWLLTKLLIPYLPESHPWKNRPFFTLKDWSNNSTELNYILSILLWASIFSLIKVSLVILKFYI
jgi:hypothetical protein